jgi:hypothetical protein
MESVRFDGVVWPKAPSMKPMPPPRARSPARADVSVNNAGAPDTSKRKKTAAAAAAATTTTTTTNVTTRALVPADARARVCELCAVKYEHFATHITTPTHRAAFARDHYAASTTAAHGVEAGAPTYNADWQLLSALVTRDDERSVAAPSARQYPVPTPFAPTLIASTATPKPAASARTSGRPVPTRLPASTSGRLKVTVTSERARSSLADADESTEDNDDDADDDSAADDVSDDERGDVQFKPNWSAREVRGRCARHASSGRAIA